MIKQVNIAPVEGGGYMVQVHYEHEVKTHFKAEIPFITIHDESVLISAAPMHKAPAAESEFTVIETETK